MSHVSEYAIEDRRECEDIQLGFQRKFKRSAKNQLSEIAAYYILGSPAFGTLLEEVDRLCRPPQVRNLQEKLQHLVIGKTMDEEFPLLHELVTGPFDADKLDYLTRDARMCGVPAVADVQRLIQKVRAVRTDRAGLPRRLKSLTNQRQTYLITGIARSGARTLDEVALARTLMFDKVYRHQKVRAAESMVFSLMEQLGRVVPTHPAMLPFMLADDEILGLNADAITALAVRHGGKIDNDTARAVETAAYLARRLRDRRLFSRCFAFAAVMPRDGYRFDPTQREGLERFIADCLRADKRQALSAEIAALVRKICDTIGDPELANVRGGALEPYIWISPPKPPPKTSSAETGHAYLIDEVGNLVQAEEDTAETPGWADAYVATRDLGYVFSLRRLKPVVYVATEALVRKKYGVRMPEMMLAYAKQDPLTVDTLKQQLADAGWYDGFPLDIRPLPATLRRADAVDRADDIVGRLAGYAGPYQATHVNERAPASSVSRQQVLAFARQFEDDELVDVALEVLANMKIIGRPDANEALTGFLELHPDFEGASYCALGESRDSSGLLTYYVGDTAKQRGLSQWALSDALAHDKPIIFVDDLVARGSQSISIIESWLGVPPTQRLNERRTEKLSDLHAEALRTHQLGFVFVAGLSQGSEALLRRTADLGLDAKVYVHIPEERLPFVDTVVTDPDLRNRFKDFCKDIGLALLVENGTKHDEDWASERVLGYGNRGLLLASTYNTPTATLTCLWKENRSALEWIPLLPRRKKE
jgi:hypothetical protein